MSYTNTIQEPHVEDNKSRSRDDIKNILISDEYLENIKSKIDSISAGLINISDEEQRKKIAANAYLSAQLHMICHTIREIDRAHFWHSKNTDNQIGFINESEKRAYPLIMKMYDNI